MITTSSGLIKLYVASLICQKILLTESKSLKNALNSGGGLIDIDDVSVFVDLFWSGLFW